MKSKHQLFFVIFLICILFFSCEQPKNEVSVQEYSTPTIKGMLSLPNGSTVNPADIYVKVIDSTGATAKVQKANSDKTFVVQGLNADMSYSILFSSVEPEFTNRTISRDPDKSNGVGGWIHDVKPAIKEGNDIGSVKLKPLGTIRGKALIDGKAEHYDTTVYIPGTSYISMTNADGTFAIYNVPEGTYTLRYTHDGYMPMMTEGVILTCPEDAKNPEITTRDVKLVSSSGTVEGVALYDGLTSHSGINVKLESEDRTKAAQASTSEDGSYVFNDVAPGVYRVIVSASGYVSMSSGYFTVESATLTSVPERTVLYRNVGSVKGTVKLSESQTDSSGIVLSFVSSEDTFTAVTDKDGYFSRRLKPGLYTVTASYPGHTSQSLEVTVTENALTEINLPSLPLASGAVAGFVVLSGSEDYSGVVITLTNSNAMTESYTAVTAADGSFRFTGLNKGGTYLLTYSKDGYVSDNSRSIDVTVGSVANAGSVTLKSTFATVKGTIQLEGASSYENVTILLRNDKVRYTSTTDQKGGYVINRVLPGTYTLLASKDGYVTGQITDIVIEPSSDKQTDLLSLSVAIKSVTGSVELELATDHAGVLVTATNLSDNKLIYSAITNSSGNFTLAGMKSGEYSVVLSCTGYNTIMLPTINVVDTTVFPLPKQNLSISRGKISGLVKIEGYTDYSGVKVSLLGTEYSSLTEKDGSFVIEVPSRNYPGGLRYEFTDYETSSYPSTIPVLTNSTYAVPDVELKAINVPIVEGSVSVMGIAANHYENIHVYLEDLPSYRFETDTDGKWKLEHVPLGKHTLVVERENAKKVTRTLYLTPAPSVRLDNIELIPDSATIYGKAYLSGMDDSSGITVSVTTPDGIDLFTVTDSNGYYYISNIVASKSHEVIFEKSGWNSASFSIAQDELKPLDYIDMTESHPISLTDTTSPELTGMSVTLGKGIESGREVGIYLYAKDEGSGIKYIYTDTDSNFSNAERKPYYNPYTTIIPDELGEKTIYVKVEDGSGNVSFVKSSSVTIVNDKTELFGPLSDDKLHLIKENSPYLITGNVLVEKGKIMTIDPGVEIQITGDYYIQVEGKLSAVGTEQERIKIYGIDDGAENWDGLKFIYDNDSLISHIDVTGHKNGITGYCDIDHALITANGWAIGKEKSNNPEYSLRGSLTNSTVKGSVSVKNGDVRQNSIIGNEVLFSDSQFICDNIIDGSTEINSSYIDGSTFNGPDITIRNSFIYNSIVSTNTVHSYNDIHKYVTYNGCMLFLGNYGPYSNEDISASGLYNIQFNNCSFPSFESDVKDSNFINCSSFTVESGRTSANTPSARERYSCTGNYWGDINTVEIKSKGEGQNLSFITDYYDDFNKTRIDYSGYRESPVEDAGYHGQEPNGPYSGYSIGDTGPAGGLVFYDKGYYSDGWRYLEVTPSDIGNYMFGYYKSSGKNYMLGTSKVIGTGRYNTERLVEHMDIEGKAYSSESGLSTEEYTAKKCLDYSYGGYEDWFLPSQEELHMIYENLYKEGLGNFSGGDYWSSSEHGGKNSCSIYFCNGEYRSFYSRYFNLSAVAVRAF